MLVVKPAVGDVGAPVPYVEEPPPVGQGSQEGARVLVQTVVVAVPDE